MDNLDHLFVAGFSAAKSYKSSLKVRSPESPQRARGAHGARLLDHLARLRVDAADLARRREELGLPASTGMTIAIEFAKEAKFDVKSLEWKSAQIEVLGVSEAGNLQVVAVFVPEGKLSAFEERITAYLDEQQDKVSRSGKKKPVHARLVNAIESFQRAAFQQLWTDGEAPPPEPEVVAWFQVWLRHAGPTAEEVAQEFNEKAKKFGVEVEPGYRVFPGRVVVAARCTRKALEQAIELLDLVAEIRSVQPNAEFFLADLKPREQAEWVRDLHSRSKFAPHDGDAPYVTLLDTGVNRAHILLSDALHEADMHAALADWGTGDHEGHGSEMAGIACFGNLVDPCVSSQPVEIPHRLESVKVLPPKGITPPHLYGWVYGQAVSIVEAHQGDRQRVFATMTTAIGPTAGMPSEWSATLDQMAFGLSPEMPYAAGSQLPDQPEDALMPRLFVLSAGNVPWADWDGYPSRNSVTGIEDPGQSWNALTVGACTDLVDIDPVKWQTHRVIASAGTLAPASTTSAIWSNPWPVKPDVVAEGGNGVYDEARDKEVLVGPESLCLLTTSHRQDRSPFAESFGTSPAAAEVARICAHVQARYPDYWPQTIRALVVQGARHSRAMLAQLPRTPRKRTDIKNLVRTYGHGKVSLNNSVSCASSGPTMVIQELITPYVKRDGRVQLNQMQLHALPWPTEELERLGAAQIEMKVTLSYFIEPNPSRRGWQSKFRYQSHGLRFAVKGSTETQRHFEHRINQLERDLAERADEAVEDELFDPDNDAWQLGASLRARGSIHSDLWTGTAAQLAQKSAIAVYPVGGWWKDWSDSRRDDLSVRYALIVSLVVADGVEVDLYTPIKTAIEIQTTTAIEVPAT